MGDSLTDFYFPAPPFHGKPSASGFDAPRGLEFGGVSDAALVLNRPVIGAFHPAGQWHSPSRSGGGRKHPLGAPAAGLRRSHHRLGPGLPEPALSTRAWR